MNRAMSPALIGTDREGRAIEPRVRREMERLFDADFARVRIHESGAPARLGASALACGSDLYFRPGSYLPRTPQGRGLLAHELTHVLQQGAESDRSGRVRHESARLLDDPALEREAGRMQALAIAGRRVASHAERPCLAVPAGSGPVAQPLAFALMFGQTEEVRHTRDLDVGKTKTVKVGGSARFATEAELVEWINDKIKRGMEEGNIKSCAAYALAHKGMGGGGAPGKFTYHGRSIYHISHGQRGKTTGCTLFFAPAVKLEEPNAMAPGIILAIGSHTDDVKGKPFYSIDWVNDAWKYNQPSIQF